MEVLGRYHPLYVIGRGGMGTIEVAVERGAVGDARVVALKRMLPGVRDRKHADMFMREARLATLLNHDNVVHAFAFGEQDGELVIAMEYVVGETLASLENVLGAKGARVPLDVAMWVLAELCDGLHAAHELRDVSGAPLGVVHRDVCPHNAMLSYHGEVKLLDFGVAKLGNAHLTKTGEVKGKTAYMSPEQAMGDALDRRSDLYGVGAMLFELVTGRRMWSGETDLELLRQLALGEAPRLAEAAPDTPRALSDLHALLVAKKATDRPSNAADVAETLRATMNTSSEDARAALVALLGDVYADAAREKRRTLEAALDSAQRDDDPRSAEPGAVIASAAPQRREASRIAPWMYGLVGAAIASAAVLVARREPARTPASTASTSSTSSIASAAPSPSASGIALEPTPTTAQTATTNHVRASMPAPRDTSRVHVAPARSVTPPASTTPARPAHPDIDVDTHPI